MPATVNAAKNAAQKRAAYKKQEATKSFHNDIKSLLKRTPAEDLVIQQGATSNKVTYGVRPAIFSNVDNDTHNITIEFDLSRKSIAVFSQSKQGDREKIDITEIVGKLPESILTKQKELIDKRKKACANNKALKEQFFKGIGLDKATKFPGNTKTKKTKKAKPTEHTFIMPANNEEGSTAVALVKVKTDAKGTPIRFNSAIFDKDQFGKLQHLAGSLNMNRVFAEDLTGNKVAQKRFEGLILGSS